MSSLQKFLRIRLEKIKIEVDPLADEKPAVKNNEEVGPYFTLSNIKNELDLADTSNWHSIRSNHVPQHKENIQANDIAFENSQQNCKFEIPDLVTKIKREDTDENEVTSQQPYVCDSFEGEFLNCAFEKESINRLTCKLVSSVSNNFKTEPESPEPLQLEHHQNISDSEGDCCYLDSNKKLSTDDVISSSAADVEQTISMGQKQIFSCEKNKSNFDTHSSFVKLKNCSVRVEDLFSSTKRKQIFNCQKSVSNFDTHSSFVKLKNCSVRVEDLFSSTKKKQIFSCQRSESNFDTHSSFVKLKNCSVRVEDLFSSTKRSLRKAHFNYKFCLCFHCRGRFKYASPLNSQKSQEYSNVCRRKHYKCAIKKLSDSNPAKFQQAPALKSISKAHCSGRHTKYGDCPGEPMEKGDSQTHFKSQECSNVRRQKHKYARDKLPECDPANSRQKLASKGVSKVYNNERRFECGDCPEEPKQIGPFKMHLRTGGNGNQHGSESIRLTSDSSIKRTCTWSDIEKTLKCSRCIKNFKCKRGLRLHFRKKHVASVKCVLCSMTFKLDRCLNMHMIRHHSNERPYKCEQCASTFKLSRGLNKHLIEHKAERLFACSQCPKSFKRPSQLKEHVFVHTKARSVGCKQCDKKFKHEHKLNYHIVLVHGSASETPYKCKECSAAFKLPYDLKQHLRTHSNEKPYSCSYCSARFKNQTCWKDHCLGHIRPFECAHCGKNFLAKSYLKQHLETHNNEGHVECNKCSAKFKSKYNLRAHIIRRHTHIRPFQCKQCLLTFKVSNDLTQHLRRHNNKKKRAHQLRSKHLDK